MVEISNLNYSFNDKELFKDLTLKIDKNDFVFISGPNSCGKTTLLKIIASLIKTNVIVNTDEIGIVFENPENFFVAEKVSDEITFILDNLNYKKAEKETLLKEVTELLDIENLLSLNPHLLSGGEKELVALAAALISKPKLLLIDGTFSMLDEVTKEKVMKILKKLNKNMTIICTTNNLEDSLYGKRLVLIDKKVILNEKINKAFDDEKIFKKCHLEMPFMASLSHKLKYYDLTDEVILNVNTMVNKLWK